MYGVALLPLMGLFVDFQVALNYLRLARIIEKLRETECRETNLWKRRFSDRSPCVVM